MNLEARWLMRLTMPYVEATVQDMDGAIVPTSKLDINRAGQSPERIRIMSELTVTNNAEIVERVVLQGDLSRLSSVERVAYYRAVCDSVGLNPLTKPFDYIKLNGKTVLYAKRDATDQLRKKHNVSVNITKRDYINDVYIVTAKAKMPNGREDESTGVVAIKGFQGDKLANALMKAETKSKRRVTLSIVGLGWLDETEVETVPGFEYVPTQEVDGIVDVAPEQTPKVEYVDTDTIENPVQAFWTFQRSNSIDKQVALDILAECEQDFTCAYEMLKKFLEQETTPQQNLDDAFPRDEQPALIDVNPTVDDAGYYSE